MPRIDNLKNKVEALYKDRRLNHADWAGWLFENHIFVVADYARELTKRFGGNEELVMAASMLHDIADAVMLRSDERHEKESERIGRRFLLESGFSEDEIKIIMDDAIAHHGCYEGSFPQTIEGKIMATADALAHLRTNFYDFALSMFEKDKTKEEIKHWALPKIERDYNNKIFFDDVRKESTADYQRVKALFINL